MSSRRSRRFVLLAHDAERSGDTVVLIELVRWLCEQADVDVEVVLFRGGPLLDELRSRVPVQVVVDLPRRSVRGVVERLLFALRASLGYRYRGRRLGLGEAPAAYYVHNLFALHLLRCVPADGTVVVRVPLLDEALERFLSRPDLRLLLDRADHFLVLAESTERELTAHHQVPEAKVGRVDEAFTIDDARVRPSSTTVADLRRAVGLADDEVVVGVVGAPTRVNGADFVPLVVRALEDRLGETVRWSVLWVAPPHADPWAWMVHDLEHSGGSARVRLLDTADPAPALCQIDVLLVPSREASPARPALEVLALGVPFVAFEGSQLAELTADGPAGTVVGFGDVGLLADAMAHLVTDEAARAAAGRAAADAVKGRHAADVSSSLLGQELLQRCR